MGISGLLPLLKEIQTPRNIADFKGKRLAVDAYVWLHKGAFGCAEDLVKGKKTTRFVDYAMYRVRMLRFHDIKPFVVFDGGPLPAKRGTEVSRARSRADHLARAQAFEAQGRLKDARDCYTKCLDITPEMAYQLIKALRAEGVDYVVAPYEADAQLCFLEREGFVDGVITEDSDLLVFGCKTVIFKLEKDGSCVSVDRSRLATVRSLPMHGWTDVQFRRMAMLSGCDYLPSIPGIGLKKAHRMLRRYKTVEKLLQALRLEGSHNIPSDYSAAFAQAELAFIYQRVFCPEQRCLVPLNDFPDGGLSDDDAKWVGLDVEVEVARGMALGDVHPETREPIEDLWPDFKPSPTEGVAESKTGTLDAFFTRSKRPKSRPAPVQPVGAFASGPTRLSDLPDGRGVRRRTPSPPPGEVKRSKFFGGQPALADEPAEPVTPAFDLKWEESTHVPTQLPRSSRRSATPEDIRSPSPVLHDVDNDAPFTSPVSAPNLSSPLRSTPRRRDLSETLDDRPEPSSPTPTPLKVLVAASSQFATCATETQLEPTQTDSPLGTQSTQFTVATVATVGSASQIGDLDSSLGVTPLRRLSHLAVLVPASSPGLRRSVPPQRSLYSARSSDSAADDDIVTPSLPAQPKRRRVDSKAGSSSGGSTMRIPKARRSKRGSSELDDEQDDADRERAARARVVAEGWRQKYALDASSSPGPIGKVVNNTASAFKPLPLSAAPKVVLAAREINSGAGDTPTKPVVHDRKRPARNADDGDRDTPVPERKQQVDIPAPDRKLGQARLPSVPVQRKPARSVSAPAGPPAANPHGLTWAALERFRFARR